MVYKFYKFFIYVYICFVYIHEIYYLCSVHWNCHWKNDIDISK